MHNALLTCQSFRRKTAYFTEQNVLLKQPVRIDYLIKKKNYEARLQGNRPFVNLGIRTSALELELELILQMSLFPVP